MASAFSDIRLDGSDNGCGSGSWARIGSPLAKDPNTLYLGKSSLSFATKLHAFLLSLAFGSSIYLLLLTVTTATRNHSMLNSLQPYAVDLANMTNKTWGYGGMPVKMNSGDKIGGHKHGKPSMTETALDPEDTAVIYRNSWVGPDGEEPMALFPTTSDTLDELRPDEVVTYDMNFLVKKHVSTVVQYNRRIAANESFRLSHTTCAVQAFMPPHQTVSGNKTWLTSNTPLDVWLLDTPPNGPWWTGKDFIKNGNYTLRSNMTWNSKPARKQKLGTIHAWPGMNLNTDTFECPKPSGRYGERIAVEYACTPGPEEESCYLSFNTRMVYPILSFEVVFG